MGWTRVWATVVGVALLCTACGDPNSTDGEVGPSAADEPSSAEPFVVGEVPAGYRLVAAGTGTRRQSWGDDTEGSSSPSTVLRRGEDVAVVTTYGYEGSQGGFGYDSAAPGNDRFRIDGDPALFFSSSESGSSVSVDRGSDMALAVTSQTATKDDLVEIARAARPPEDTWLPAEVPEPPDGWTVVGSMAADAVIALSYGVQENTDEVPGSIRSYGAGWLADGPTPSSRQEQLVVVSMPAGSVDLDALLTSSIQLYGTPLESTPATVRGRPAATIERCFCELTPPLLTRAVVSTAFDRSVVMVVAIGEAPPSPDQLLATAASVTPATAEEWEQMMIAAAGGPGLHPDAGRSVLATGEVAGVEWLMQTGGISEPDVPGEAPATIDADPCLKLSNRTRVCADAGGGSPGETVMVPTNGDAERAGFPQFVVVTTRTPGVQLRVRTPTDTATGALHPIPGSDTFAGIVFVDDAGLTGCPDRTGAPPSTISDLELTYIDVLDADGNVVGCPGGW